MELLVMFILAFIACYPIWWAWTTTVAHKRNVRRARGGY